MSLMTFYRHNINRNFHKLKEPIYCIFKRKSFSTFHILGIESSCDDTGAAIVNNHGSVLGESLLSQQNTHLKLGGIIPPIAAHLHKQNITPVVDEALKKANFQLEDLDAIAVTNQPGMILPLNVGLSYAKQLCSRALKPLIPIHHMQAHALTIRMVKTVEFPFLVILISGGHCLLSIAQNPEKFILLGKCLDDAPGEAFDKAARRLKLRNLPEFSQMGGGQAIEILASSGDPLAFDFTTPLNNNRDCNFSFSGIKTKMNDQIIRLEKQFELEPDAIVPHLEDLCASFQWVVAKHLAMRVNRAIEFVTRTNLIPPDKRTLVVSGGVACNRFIINILKEVGNQLNFEVCAPPPKLCTDNGIMIAWNGMEKWKYNKKETGTLNYESVNCHAMTPIGEDISEQITEMSIPLTPFKYNRLVRKSVEINLNYVK